jgi:hypothetical protein
MKIYQLLNRRGLAIVLSQIAQRRFADIQKLSERVGAYHAQLARKPTAALLSALRNGEY